MPQKIPRRLAKSRSLKRFFTGVPCQYGHISERLVSNKACYTCHLMRGAAFRAANPNYFKEANRTYYWDDLEGQRERIAAWQRDHPLEMAQARKRRRARKKGALGSHILVQIRAMLVAQRGLCVGCGCDISANYTEDHIIPLEREGSDYIENIQLMCSPCNSSKGVMTMAEWLARPPVVPRRDVAQIVREALCNAR